MSWQHDWQLTLRGGRGKKWSLEHVYVLKALFGGQMLKSHRNLDGAKVYRLHSLEGAGVVVTPAVVHALYEAGYLQTNHKFPTATYLLTPHGQEVAHYLMALDG